ADLRSSQDFEEDGAQKGQAEQAHDGALAAKGALVNVVGRVGRGDPDAHAGQVVPLEAVRVQGQVDVGEGEEDVDPLSIDQIQNGLRLGPRDGVDREVAEHGRVQPHLADEVAEGAGHGDAVAGADGLGE